MKLRHLILTMNCVDLLILIQKLESDRNIKMSFPILECLAYIILKIKRIS